VGDIVVENWEKVLRDTVPVKLVKKVVSVAGKVRDAAGIFVAQPLCPTRKDLPSWPP
jgi:hypothetical protein